MLLNNQKNICGPILVSGATGGVGSFAINILNKIGFETIAITRNKNSITYLKKIGADKIIMYPR
jgi:NADPH:quinone reductase-like Zn-dependent oxidoreductase